MTGKLTIERDPYVPRSRVVTADCPHGRTTVTVVDGAYATLSDAEAARMVAARLLAEEGCRCARRLARKVGAA